MRRSEWALDAAQETGCEDWNSKNLFKEGLVLTQTSCVAVSTTHHTMQKAQSIKLPEGRVGVGQTRRAAHLWGQAGETPVLCLYRLVTGVSKLRLLYLD